MDIALDKVCAFIRQARRFDVKEGDTDPDDGSNPVDDRSFDVLDDSGDDSIEQELRNFLAGLNEDERADLVALVWVGRGDFDAEDWDEATRTARERQEGDLGDYLLGIPNLPDLVDEGLAAFDLSCVDENAGAGV